MKILKDKELPTIIGERVILRIPQYNDIDAIITYFIENKSHLEPFEPKKSEFFYTEEYWKKDISKRVEDFHQGLSLRMFVFNKQNQEEVIGVVNLNNIVRGVFQASYLGYSIGKKYEGMGYMKESLSLAIAFVFEEMNLHRIMANYMPHNRKSGNLLKRLGFIVEGYARDYLMINGRFEDHILTSLTNYNWKETV